MLNELTEKTVVCWLKGPLRVSWFCSAEPLVSFVVWGPCLSILQLSYITSRLFRRLWGPSTSLWLLAPCVSMRSHAPGKGNVLCMNYYELKGQWSRMATTMMIIGNHFHRADDIWTLFYFLTINTFIVISSPSNGSTGVWNCNSPFRPESGNHIFAIAAQEEDWQVQHRNLKKGLLGSDRT